MFCYMFTYVCHFFVATVNSTFEKKFIFYVDLVPCGLVKYNYD